ncbi:hypothetical protein COCMIDRAFT_28624 [Bipolaris oryzae ATCC 44560]|uniref:Uncharacterized protein n=1 Tax=Bipolaris oryzae ATCC 44560 TaxID=930090 RepID=W6YZ23_COCMI|nr:uncharacterized protein COCMIDRAFT_28624 [Bipolaris oryzae ATCC 44560]EUC42828.1 hypothetical protein COCMIDRAFT_28624 [Bipolaris oryzae ATCC 44560]
MLTQRMVLIAERHGHQTNVEKKNSYRLDSWAEWRILTGAMVQRPGPDWGRGPRKFSALHPAPQSSVDSSAAQWACSWGCKGVYSSIRRQNSRVRGVGQRRNKSDKKPDGENSKDVDLCRRMAKGDGWLQLHGGLARPGTVCRARYPDTRSRILRPQRPSFRIPICLAYSKSGSGRYTTGRCNPYLITWALLVRLLVPCSSRTYTGHAARLAQIGPYKPSPVNCPTCPHIEFARKKGSDPPREETLNAIKKKNICSRHQHKGTIR